MVRTRGGEKFVDLLELWSRIQVFFLRTAGWISSTLKLQKVRDIILTDHSKLEKVKASGK